MIKPHPLQSVRVRITLAAVAVTALAVATTGWLLLRSVEDDQMGDMRAGAETQLDLVARALAQGESPEDALYSSFPFGVMEIRDADGALLAANPEFSLIGGTGVAAVTRGPNGEGGETASGRSEPIDGETEVIPGAHLPFPTECPSDADTCTVQVQAAPQAKVLLLGDQESISREIETPTGTMTVSSDYPVSVVEQNIEAVRKSVWILLPGLVAVVALVAWWLAGRALRPVEQIRLEAEAIGGSTIHRRLPELATGDEIGRLSKTMNAMLERLDHSARRQRQFVSDASHELRSPLAAIRTDLEVALREGDEADWPRVATAVLGEEARLEDLLADLLVLAADDERANGLPDKPVDLGDVVVEEAERHDLVANLPDGDVRTRGSASQLRRAVGNLIGNAVRHAETTVEVGLAHHGDRIRITVDDDGPGVPPPDRERIFERFTRLDDGRAREQGGAGLGLAVVRSIVVRHGGQVWTRESPLGGARFTIELPAR